MGWDAQGELVWARDRHRTAPWTWNGGPDEGSEKLERGLSDRAAAAASAFLLSQREGVLLDLRNSE